MVATEPLHWVLLDSRLIDCEQASIEGVNPSSLPVTFFVIASYREMMSNELLSYALFEELVPIDD